MKSEDCKYSVFAKCVNLIDSSDLEKVNKLKYACLKGNIKTFENDLGDVVGYIIWCKVSKYTILGCAKFNWFPHRYWEKDEGNITFIESIVIAKKEPYLNLKRYLREFFSKHRAIFFKSNSVSRLWMYSKLRKRCS